MMHATVQVPPACRDPLFRTVSVRHPPHSAEVSGARRIVPTALRRLRRSLLSCRSGCRTLEEIGEFVIRIVGPVLRPVLEVDVPGSRRELEYRRAASLRVLNYANRPDSATGIPDSRPGMLSSGLSPDHLLKLCTLPFITGCRRTGVDAIVRTLLLELTP